MKEKEAGPVTLFDVYLVENVRSFRACYAVSARRL